VKLIHRLPCHTPVGEQVALVQVLKQRQDVVGAR
jgi:hypothetical protein